MFFFYIILVMVFLIVILAVFTTINLHIQNIKFSTKKREKRYLNKDYKISIELYLFNKIRFFKLDITKNKLEKEKIHKNIYKMEKQMIKNINSFDIKILKNLKYLQIKLKKLNLNIDIGLEDAATNAICVGTVSAIIAIILQKFTTKENNQYFWKITPIYQNRNLLNVKLDCIFSLKLIHIIYTIYVLKKKGEENDRTSNRRAYAYSNE